MLMGKLPPCLTPECLAKLQQLNDDHEAKISVENNLHHAGTTIDAVHDTMAKVHEFIEKGAGERKKQAEIQKWRNDMRKYEEDITSLPAELENAEKHYLSLAGWTWPGRPDQKYLGDSAYRNKKYYDYLQTEKKQKEVALAESDATIDRLNTLLDGYRTSLIYASKMHDLYDVRNQENADLRKALNMSRTTALTNARRVFYENIELRNLVASRCFVYFIMFASFILYFFLGDVGVTAKTLQTDGFYKSKSFHISAVLTTLYLTLPIWINSAVLLGFRIWRWLHYIRKNYLPENVYSSL